MVSAKWRQFCFGLNMLSEGFDTHCVPGHDQRYNTFRPDEMVNLLQVTFTKMLFMFQYNLSLMVQLAISHHWIKPCLGQAGDKLLPHPTPLHRRTFASPYIPQSFFHDGVIKWKHFPRYWPFVQEIHRTPVNSPHKGQWRGALMLSLICARTNG